MAAQFIFLEYADTTSAFYVQAMIRRCVAEVHGIAFGEKDRQNVKTANNRSTPKI